MKVKILLLLLLTCPLFAHAQEVSVDKFDWLVGCWEGEADGKKFFENWSRPTAIMMIGLGRTLKDGNMIQSEFLQIAKKEDGIYYIAKPMMGRETPFKLVRSGFHQATFENPDHDFPQRVIYRLVSDNQLLARIEGTNEGKQEAVDYPMKRVTCGTQ